VLLVWEHNGEQPARQVRRVHCDDGRHHKGRPEGGVARVLQGLFPGPGPAQSVGRGRAREPRAAGAAAEARGPWSRQHPDCGRRVPVDRAALAAHKGADYRSEGRVWRHARAALCCRVH